MKLGSLKISSTGHFELSAATGDPRKRGAVILDEVAGRVRTQRATCLADGAGWDAVTAVFRRSWAVSRRGVQAAAVPQVRMQLLGAAGSFVPTLPQSVLVRAEHARPGQADPTWATFEP